ncbi:MAG TPA: molecular chaperone HtpG [Gammaproteobacteria bacterium]|nr:molecular chaperone HtpG [Gammaproteobacteria bacterium]|tara:strand:- start:857 stop:2734 length:1878 start_codon:yes stop_codon:yes gene_type:complete
MTIETTKETLGFESEVNQLLHLVINSMYSNREIFLRELISNSADAADKLRFAALTDDGLFEGDTELKITVDFSEKLKTITVRDNGIGMSREEAVEHLGTIAKSGTKEFFGSLSGDAQQDSQLIGQFGVGFYAAYIVADKVVVTSRRAGRSEDEGVRWESDGQGEFTVESVKRKKRGTEVVLHLKDDAAEFANGYRLRDVVKRYSDHIATQIEMPKEGEGETGYEAVNTATALWTRNKKDISDDEYKAFYKHIAHDFEDPASWIHTKSEGKLEYTTVFFIPSRAPFDLFDRQARHGVKLYVQRVFIMDDADQLLPNYLRFVRGIVDSNDLPLNVSREILQHNKAIDSIRAGSIKKILSAIEAIAKGDEYGAFWKNFGRVLKEGVVEDPSNQKQLVKLLRFVTTISEGDDAEVSIEDYVDRMIEGQESIYYLTAETLPTARHSPHLEVFREKNIEVLLLCDPVDEWVTTHLSDFEGKPLKSILHGELDLPGGKPKEDAEDVDEDKSEDHEELVGRIKNVLGDTVKDVRSTARLTTSPACLVSDDTDMSANLERILKASGQELPDSKRILEVNPTHPLVKHMDLESEESKFANWAHILFEQALLAEGGKLDDPAAFVNRMNDMLLKIS